MARTHKDKPIRLKDRDNIKRKEGYEFWSKRPVSNRHGAPTGKFTKKRTHRLERIIAKKEIQQGKTN